MKHGSKVQFLITMLFLKTNTNVSGWIGQKTHPPDPNDAKKFKRNGGGVLIAVKNDLDVVSRKIKINVAAELLVVQLKLSNGTKYIFSTCYRVNTLGLAHHRDVIRFIHPLLAKTKPPKFFMIGDLNLSKVNWTLGRGSNLIEQSFLALFVN